MQLGAWDYQTKPVSLEYLIVRIESFFQIKQQAFNVNNQSSNKSYGELIINTGAMQCFWKEDEVRLTPTEFSILSAIAASADAISIDDLVKVTRQGIVEDNTVNTHILHIRKKFKAADPDFSWIKTRYGFGYQWVNE